MKERQHTRRDIYPSSHYEVKGSRPGLDAFTVLMVGIGIVALIIGPITGLYSLGIGFGALAGATILALFPRLDPLTVLLIGGGILALIVGPVVGLYSWALGAVALIGALVLAISWRVYLEGTRSRDYEEPPEY